MFLCNNLQQESNNPQGKFQAPILDKRSNYLCRKKESKLESVSKKEKDILPPSQYPESFHSLSNSFYSILKLDAIRTSKVDRYMKDLKDVAYCNKYLIYTK